jgi:hypothetical protein
VHIKFNLALFIKEKKYRNLTDKKSDKKFLT